MTGSLAHSAPIADRVQQVIKYKSYYDSLWANFYGGNVSLNVSGSVYDDFSGVVSTKSLFLATSLSVRIKCPLTR